MSRESFIERSSVLFVRSVADLELRRHVDALAAGLRRLGWRVGLVHPAGEEPASGVASHPITIANHVGPPTEPDGAAQIAKLFKDYDIVHAHGMRAAAYTALALTLVKRELGPRVPRLIVTLHDAVYGATTNESFMNTALGRVVVDVSDHVLCVSQDIQNFVESFGHGHVTRAITPDLWESMDQFHAPHRKRVADLRAELNVPNGKFLALVVADLQPRKCIDMVIDAMGDSAVSQNWHLVVIGDGSQKESLAAQALRLFGDSVHPLSWFNERPDVPQIIAASDALLISSQWEGKPQTLQHALKCGTPVVATCTGGIPELVGAEHQYSPEGIVIPRTTDSYDVNGAAMLIAVDDEAALRDALCDLTGLPYRVRMSELGRARAAHLDTISSALAQVEKVYLGALAYHSKVSAV